MGQARRIGDYEVLRTLGQGGMGVVLEVRDPHTGRSLAVKLIRSASPKLEARFVREAEVLGKIQHRNVVRIFDFGRKPEGLVIVQEMIEGRGLDELTREGPLPPQQAAKIVRDLADALAAVHRRAILHRDLKPANVILRPDGIPVLLDFGMARDESAMTLTKSGAFLGTPAYMSPEQADGNGKLDSRADVYGLGAILYELVTGEKPYSGTTINILHSILKGTAPPSVSQVRPDAPPGLNAIALKAMARDPADRYQDMEGFREDLDRHLAGRSPSAMAELSEARRSGALGWAALGLALLVGGGGALAYAYGGGGEQEQETTPRRTRRTPAQEKPLLHGFAKGDVFDYRYGFFEDNQDTTLTIGGVHRAEVLDADDERLTIECTAVSVHMTFGSTARITYDSARLDDLLDEEHPLYPARGILGARFRIEVERATGAVSCSGMKALREPMVRALMNPELPYDVNLGVPTKQLLTDRHIGTSLDTLWRVRGGELEWKTRGGDSGEHRLVAVGKELLVVPTIWRPEQKKAASTDGVDHEGVSVYRDGRPVRAEIKQSCSKSFDPPLRSSWSYELLPPPPYDGYRVGETFRYAYRFAEYRGGASFNDVRGVHEVTVREAVGDLLWLDCTAHQLRIGYGDGPTAKYYDTDEKNDGPTQLKTGAENTLGKRFQIALDRRTGQLRVRDMANLQKPMVDALKVSPFPGANFHAVPYHWLRDRQIRRTLQTLFAVSGEDALPWKETRDGHHLLRQEKTPRVLAPLTNKSKGEVQLEGNLLRKNGRMVEGELKQTHADGTVLVWSYREVTD